MHGAVYLTRVSRAQEIRLCHSATWRAGAGTKIAQNEGGPCEGPHAERNSQREARRRTGPRSWPSAAAGGQTSAQLGTPWAEQLGATTGSRDKIFTLNAEWQARAS